MIVVVAVLDVAVGVADDDDFVTVGVVGVVGGEGMAVVVVGAVSYTHLTLPTN